MKTSKQQVSLESLSSLHDLQRQVCDLAAIKCNGQMRVHVECQQGRHRNAVIISNQDNNRSLRLFLKASGWHMVAKKGSQTSWKLALIGPTDALIETIESRIEAFLLPRPLYQTLLFNVKHSLGGQQADRRTAAR